MSEILVASNHDATGHYNNPYTEAGARTVLRRFRDDLLKMLEHMERMEDEFKDEGGKTFLAKSPLRSKIYVAAAMKTLGLVRERSSSNGSCILILTERGRIQIDNARALGWLPALP